MILAQPLTMTVRARSVKLAIVSDTDSMDVPTEKLAKAMKEVLKPAEPHEKILQELQLLHADIAKEGRQTRFMLGLSALLLLIAGVWILIPKHALVCSISAIVAFVVCGFINRKRH